MAISLARAETSAGNYLQVIRGKRDRGGEASTECLAPGHITQNYVSLHGTVATRLRRGSLLSEVRKTLCNP